MLSRLRLPTAWLVAVTLLLLIGPPPAELFDVRALGAAFSTAPDAAVAHAAALSSWLLLAWLGAGWLAVLGARASGGIGRVSRRAAELLLPRALRTVFEGTVGVTVALSAAPALSTAPALAATAPVASQVEAIPVADVSPLPSLDRSPVTELQLAPLPAVPPPVLAPEPQTPAPDPVLRGRLPQPADEVVVRRGDCLWGIVARSLGPNADDETVAAAWPRWYAANRSAIGPDPGLLLPGQRLVPPSDPRPSH